VIERQIFSSARVLAMRLSFSALLIAVAISVAVARPFPLLLAAVFILLGEGLFVPAFLLF
jgi:hypothetical protein